MDKNFVYTCVECRLSDTIYKDTAQCKQGKFSDQLIVNRTQTALEVGSYQYIYIYTQVVQFQFHLKLIKALRIKVHVQYLKVHVHIFISSYSATR